MDAPFPEGMVQEIEAFLAADRAPVGEDVYPAVFRTNFFFPLQRQKELAQMMRWARMKRPQVVMEIGADKGGSLYHWVKCLPTVRIAVACEIRGTPYAAAFERAFPHVKFLWVEGSSYAPENRAAVADALAAASATIDCLFIDGDKLAFERDFDAYKQLMHPCGIAFMHDIQDRDPKEAFERVTARGYHSKTCVDVSDYDPLTAPSCPHDQWLHHWKGRSCGVGAVYLGGRRA